MSKTFYLLILLIINSNAWNLRIIPLSADDWLIIQTFFLLVGFLWYGRSKDFYWFSKKLKYWWIWVLGVLLSMLPAYYNYGQTISQSILTYRQCIFLVQIPFLFKIAPTKEEIVNAIMIFFGFVWIIYFIQRYNPLIVNIDEEQIEKLFLNGEMPMVAGWLYILIAMFYYLGKIKEHFNMKLLLIILSFFIFALLEQNRSALFSIAFIISWTILKVEKRKILVILTFIVLALGITYYTSDIWINLFEETAGQVDDLEYNRNKAYRYYLFDASPNIWCYIFGNGFLSAHVTRHMQDMMRVGVYDSDVGFIGYWNEFGILPIIVFMLILVPAAIGKRNSHFIRCFAIQILICSVTISYWGGGNLLYIGLFYYLYHIDLEKCGENTQIESEDLIVT